MYVLTILLCGLVIGFGRGLVWALIRTEQRWHSSTKNEIRIIRNWQDTAQLLRQAVRCRTAVFITMLKQLN
ncbi:hypothetical protein [Terribacillus aidingensis]|uniref:hypothetical protein n=1 Tax=Terribacillus aidingensis TaxID=586416 RepID=UPI000BE3D8C6|nr:hypothetical protein [Terribacillus aidingensis]